MGPEEIYSKWCIVHHDSNFGDFLGPKFPSYSVEGIGEK